MAVHALPEPESLASRLSRMFRIDLRNAEICVHKTAVSVEDLRALLGLAVSHDKTQFEQKAIRRASCTVACCAQSQGTLTGNKIEVEEIQSLVQKSSMPEHWKATVHDIVSLCANEVKSIIDECDVTFAFFMCLSREGEKYGD